MRERRRPIRTWRPSASSSAATSLVSSSRAGGQPANLQGIWNEIGLAALGQQVHDQHQHRDELLAGRGLQPVRMPPAAVRHAQGHLGHRRRRRPRSYYGCGGWVAHHNIDLWRGTAPVDAARYGMWPVGGAWLCQHLWEHYAFTGDRQFLKEYYPVMKGAGPVPAGGDGRGAEASLAGHAVLHVARARLSRRQGTDRLPLALADAWTSPSSASCSRTASRPASCSAWTRSSAASWRPP